METEKGVTYKRPRDDEVLMGRKTQIQSKLNLKTFEEVSAIRKQAQTKKVQIKSKAISGSSEHEGSRRQNFAEKRNQPGTDDDDDVVSTDDVISSDDELQQIQELSGHFSRKIQVRSKRNKDDGANKYTRRRNTHGSKSRKTLADRSQVLTPYTCAVCKKRYDEVHYLSAHVKTHAGTSDEKKFKCSVCKRLFKGAIAIWDHMLIHSALFESYGISSDDDDEEQDFLPEESLPEPSNEQAKQSGSTARKTQVRSNRNSNPGGKENERNVETSKDSENVRRESKRSTPYKCAECDKRFSYKSDLVQHFRIHSGERPFECITCKLTFNQKSHLTTHLRIHSGERPFECKICKKCFNRKSTLTSHLTIHSGERPFECKICKKCFNQKSTLTSHLTIHSGEKPFLCDICKKSFRRKSHVSRHMNIHIGKRRHRCNVCKKVFHQRHLLSEHRKVHHEEN